MDAKLFTYHHIKRNFLKHNKIKFIKENLIDQIEKKRVSNSSLFFSLDKKIVGESSNSKINKIVNYLKKNKADYLFLSAPENVAWVLNIRGKDLPNSPIANCKLIISDKGKMLLFIDKNKILYLDKNKFRNITFCEPNKFFKNICDLKKGSF